MPEDVITAGPGFQLSRYLNHEGPPPSKPNEPSSEAAEVGAAAPPTDVDTTGSSSEPEIVLPIVELPHATGPGSDDPFGIQPPALAVGYDRPLSLLDQLLTGDPSGGRTTFILPFEPGFFRDLTIATSDELRFITLRPTISDFPPVDPREQAINRLVVNGILTLGAFLTPGPQDDLALAGGATGGSAARGHPQLGGAYSQVRIAASEAGLGGQVHHMPAWAATRDAGMAGVTRGSAPAIWMSTADHARTPSFGNWTAAGAHRAQQQILIKNGRYLDALKIDIDAIRGVHGSAYDGAIQQMGECIWRTRQ